MECPLGTGCNHPLRARLQLSFLACHVLTVKNFHSKIDNHIVVVEKCQIASHFAFFWDSRCPLLFVLSGLDYVFHL